MPKVIYRMEHIGNTVVVEKTLHLKNEFCETNTIPALHVYIDGKKKKKYKETKDKKYKYFIHGSVTGWRDWSKEQVEEYNIKNPKINRYKRNAYDVKIEDSKWCVLDIDYDINLTKEQNDERKNMLLEKYGNYNVTYSMGSNYPHLWRLRHKDDHHSDLNNFESGLDLRYTNIFEQENAVMHNLKLDLVFDSGRRKDKETKKNKPKKKRTIVTTQENRELNREDLVSNFGAETIEILENIDARYIDDYHIWLRLIWGLYNEFESVSLCNYLSSRGNPDKYEDATEKIMNDRKQSITYGTVIHYSMQSNMENYMKIRSDHNNLFGFDGSDESFKDLYFKLFNHDLKKNGGHIYVFKDPYWESCDSDLLATFVANCLLKFINIQIQHTDDDMVEKLTQLKTLRKTMGSWSKQKSVGKVVMNNLQNCDIKFDNKANYFCFRNCAINLDTGNKVQVGREDYITIHTGYDKIETTKEQQNVLEEIMSKIFPIKEELQSFYTLLKVTLYGKQDKRFHVLRGNGSNGKGLICEHFEQIMGNYYYKPQKEFLLNKLTEGVNEVLSNMDKKRLINFTELAKTDQIRSEIIKVLTDAPTTTARGIYEKLHTVHLDGTIWIDTNPEIKISGDVDYSIERRFVYWYFRSTFVDDPKYLTRGDNIYMKDERFKDITFVRNNRSTWIDLVLEKTQEINKLQLCNSIMDNTKKALNNMDDLLDFIEPRYERTENPDDYILLKDMYDAFRQTEEFGDMTKEEKRKWCRKNFAESVKKNINFVGDFRAKTTKNGVYVRSIFVNWKKKE